MAIKRIIKDIDINASKEKVRHVLFDDTTYRIWAAEFMEGSYAETDRQKGSEVKFLGPDGGGLLGIISQNTVGEFLEITYEGMIGNGIEDRDSEAAKMFKGTTETYTLTEENGQTHLHTEAPMDEQRLDDMNASRDRAIIKIKELAENE